MRRWIGSLGICLIAAFAVLLLALHVLAFAKDDLPVYMSHFERAEYGALWPVSLALLSAGCACLAIVIGRVVIGHPGGRLLCATMALIPVAVLGVATFPAGAPGEVPAAAAYWHDRAAATAFGATVVAMHVAAVALWRASRPVALASAVMAAAGDAVALWGWMAMRARSWDVLWSERLLVVLQGLWLLSLAVWVQTRRTPADAS